jgi:EamA-like transporter family.
VTPAEEHHNKVVALFLLSLTLLGSGSVPIFLRYLLKTETEGGLGLDIWVVNALRYSSAPVFWLPFVLMRMRREKSASDNSLEIPDTHHRSGVWKAAIVPTVFNLVTQTSWGAVGKYADANVIGFASKLAFPFTVLYSFLLFPGERRLTKTSSFWIGALGSLVGLVLLSAEKIAGSGTGGTTMFGYLLLLLMAISWGAYSVSVKKQMSGYSSILSFWVISIYTTVGLLFLMFVFGDLATFRVMDLKAWVVLIASSFIGVTFWHVMYYRALKGVGAVVSDGVLMVSPFLTVAGSAFILGETLTLLQAIGGSILVGGGIFLVVAHGRITKVEQVKF